MNSDNPPFHMAFPVKNLEETRIFYGETLGCDIGRESDAWIDFNFFGHQITAHLSKEVHAVKTSPVDGDQVPVRHFGVILTMQKWQQLADLLKQLNTQFIIQPHIRFAGQAGEQATMFFYDPSGNALEFKAFADHKMIFAR